jgi:phospholipase/lecithinase/hemolysin
MPQSLYDLGARNFMVAGLPPVGCLPVQKTLHLQQPPLISGGCIDVQNAAAERYNTKLQQTLTKLQADNAGSTFAYVDVYNPLKDMATNPQKYGGHTTN